MAETVVLLHGFAATSRAWDGVAERLECERYRPLALDLRGHGRARDARPIGFAECVADVLDQAPERFALCGYSLGGRVAQHVALAAPARVSRLILVSTSPGIEDARERAARRQADERLAAQLEGAGIEDFVARWRALPLFRDDPDWVREAAAVEQRRNDPWALAVVLRGLGTGVMAPLWARLGELRMPVDVVCGERDEKFVTLGARLLDALARTRPDPAGCSLRRWVIPGAGHVLLLEAPGALAQLIGTAPDIGPG